MSEGKREGSVRMMGEMGASDSVVLSAEELREDGRAPTGAGDARVRRTLPGELLVANTAVALARLMSPPLVKTARVEKRSAWWPFEPLMERVRGGVRALAPTESLARIESRSREVRGELRGVVKTTAFGRGVARAEAAGVCQRVSSPRVGLALLWSAVDVFRPRWVVEFGSGFGVGSSALALGLKETCGEEARFDGIEYEGWRAKIADEGVRALLGDRARVHAGDIAKALPRIARAAGVEQGARLDMAFVDAEHTYDATVGYHRALLGLARPGAIVVYDDTEWSAEMKRSWEAIVADDRVTDALSLGRRWGFVRLAGERGAAGGG